ncbi:MAG: hypothetical protein WCV67_13520 [Victivallaceae bacterium]|jgi:hypothetical protein
MLERDNSATEHKSKYAELVFPALLALITCLFFIPSIRYEMYLNLDDCFYVIYNKHIALNWSNIVYWLENSCLNLYTPLPMISYMFDYTLWGYNVAGYHLQNIIWHILTVIVIYYIFIELEIDSRIAFFMVLVFAVHPQRIESVVWITERKDVMSGFFYFSSLLVWLKSYKHGGWFSPLSCILMTLGCLSKPTAITIPVVIFCLLWRREHKIILKDFARRLAPYLLISFMYVSIKFIYLSMMFKDLTGSEKNWQRTIFMVLDNFRMYFVKTFLPNDLIPLYPYFELSASCIAVILLFYLAAAAIAFTLLFKSRDFLIYDIAPMLLCFIVTLLPIIGISHFGSADFADRYSYISSVFLWFGVAFVITRLINDKQTAFLQNSRYCRMAWAGVVCYMLYIMAYTVLYMPCWKDNYTLYLTVCDHENPNFRGLAVLADIEYSRGNYPAALACADALKPSPWMTMINKKAIELFKDYIRGMVCYSTGMKEEAMSYFSRILASPEMPVLKFMIGNSCQEIISAAGNYYIQHKEPKRAACLYAMMPKIYPEETGDCYFYRGLAAFLNGNLETARTEFMAAQKTAPSDARIGANLKRVEDLLREKGQ